MKWWIRGLILLVVVGISYTFFTPFCHVMFDCSCDLLWQGAGSMCNVHNLDGAHCSFCSTGWWGARIPRGTVWLSQTAVVLLPPRISWHSRLGLGLLAFFGVALTVGFIFWLATGYPVFSYPRF